MTSAKAECETLMNIVLPFAQRMLSDHGEFFPYGGAMRSGGEIISVAGYDGGEQPPSTNLIQLIKEGFIDAANQGQYMATALVYDVRVVMPETGEKSDAVAVSLNHRDRYSMTVLFPYKLAGGKAAFGNPFAQKGDGDIFGPL
jgi:hypothetical protein